VIVDERSRRSTSLATELIGPILRPVEGFGSLLLLTVKTLLWMLRPPYRLGQLLGSMDFVGVQSIFIVSLTGIFSGMVLALQTVNSLRQFSAEGVSGRWLPSR
jgi:phospholipid/cholesterol/gamma-HCH transport system permease protein